MPILLVLGFLLFICYLLIKGWYVAFWVVFGLLCLVIVGLVLLLCSTAFSGGTPSAPPPPPPPAKKRNQTEDEFNEMAMTNLYANYYLDQDAKKAKEAKLAAKQAKAAGNTPPKGRHRH